MGVPALQLGGIEAETPVLGVVQEEMDVDPRVNEDTQGVQNIASERTAMVLAPLIEEAVFNSIGISLLRTNISAFNTFREDHPEWTPDFSGENFEEAKLDGVNLSGAVLCKARFISASLRGANLQGANLSSVQISTADLTNSNLQNTDFSRADLCDSKLRGADIRGAKMATAEVDTGYLVTIKDRNGNDVIVLDLLGIKYDSETTLPEISNPGIETSTVYIAGESIDKSSLL